jgi:hypothetical protein
MEEPMDIEYTEYPQRKIFLQIARSLKSAERCSKNPGYFVNPPYPSELFDFCPQNMFERVRGNEISAASVFWNLPIVATAKDIKEPTQAWLLASGIAAPESAADIEKRYLSGC